MIGLNPSVLPEIKFEAPFLRGGGKETTDITELFAIRVL
jgi:hypothetical protein